MRNFFNSQMYSHLIICMLEYFLYFWIPLSTGSKIFDASHRKFSLTLLFSTLTMLLKNYLVFQQSRCYARWFHYYQLAWFFTCSRFFKKKGFNYFRKYFIVVNILNLKIAIRCYFFRWAYIFPYFHDIYSEKIYSSILIQSLFLY